MLDTRSLFESFDERQRDAVLRTLDLLTRPMTPREIDGALVGKGVSRGQRRIIAKAIAPFHIIALLGPEFDG